jgi:hypothetical protein
VVISICPGALIYARRDTPHPTMILFAAPARTAISSPTGSNRHRSRVPHPRRASTTANPSRPGRVDRAHPAPKQAQTDESVEIGQDDVTRQSKSLDGQNGQPVERRLRPYRR